MVSYKLSPLAEEDLKSIFEFGIDRFGVQQAIEYLEGLERHFDKIAETPNQYPAIDHIREGYRRGIYRAHSIYFRINRDVIEIMRVLYMQDAGSAL